MKRRFSMGGGWPPSPGLPRRMPPGQLRRGGIECLAREGGLDAGGNLE
jgi:hypothetical protein